MIRNYIVGGNKILAKTFNNFVRFGSKDSIPEAQFTQVRNGNLRFETLDWHINLYPFYPQVFKKKGKNNYEIATNSIVLAMSFINKNVDDDVAWANRKTISLKFKEFASILSVEAGSGRSVNIEASSVSKSTTNNNNTQRHRLLMLKDIPQQQKVNFSLSSVIDPTRNASLSKSQARQQEWGIHTEMLYSQYRIMYKLLQNSLLDLSGWKFMMELQKRAQFRKLQTKSYTDNQIQELLKG